MNWKRFLNLIAIVALILMNVVTLPDSIKAHAMSNEEGNDNKIYSNNYTFYEKNLFEYANDPQLNDKEIKGISELLDNSPKDVSLFTDPELNDVVTIVTAIAGIICIMGATYGAGRYAAKSLDKRGIITTSHYKKWRWLYHPAIVAAFMPVGPTIALGFDDYRYGI